METLVTFDSVNQYNAFNHHKTFHPLVSVVDFSKAGPRHASRMSFGLFAIMLKDVKSGDIKYGRNYYDYHEGTLIFFSPGHIEAMEEPLRNRKD